MNTITITLVPRGEALLADVQASGDINAIDVAIAIDAMILAGIEGIAGIATPSADALALSSRLKLARRIIGLPERATITAAYGDQVPS